MSAPERAELERLLHFEILPSPPDVDATTLQFRVKSGDWACVARRDTLRRLSDAIRKHLEDHP